MSDQTPTESVHDAGSNPGAAQTAPATKPAEPQAVAAPAAASAPRAAAGPPNRRRLYFGVIAIGLLVLAAFFGAGPVMRAFTTVSTDDAYVNGHVTFVAPRVAGQVVKVLVDDNYRVRTGDVLVQLDPEPYQVIVDAKRAAWEVATANVIVADDQVRATVAQARANRFKLERAIEDVDNQIAQLRASVAALQTAQAKLNRAEADYNRGLDLEKTPGAISQDDFDKRKESYRVAEAQEKQTLQQVYQIRASLGLTEQPANGDLTEVPKGLDQSFSTVRAALAELLQSAAPLSIIPSSYNLAPKQVIEEFYKRDPNGDIDKIYAKVIAEAPAIKLAKAQLMQAKSDLDQAKLNLRYCTVYAEIDGVVTRRDVNPGNNVIAGQSLMAIRSLREIWIDANFKETQLANLRIGQAVDLDVDMYGSHKMFKGHITGFTMGTGSTLALLPAENATGNFVKVVQRLPVRIELDPDSYDPDKVPLFIGLSVTPYVHIHEPPTGPNAGDVLRPTKPEKKP